MLINAKEMLLKCDFMKDCKDEINYIFKVIEILYYCEFIFFQFNYFILFLFYYWLLQYI